MNALLPTGQNALAALPGVNALVNAGYVIDARHRFRGPYELSTEGAGGPRSGGGRGGEIIRQSPEWAQSGLSRAEIGTPQQQRSMSPAEAKAIWQRAMNNSSMKDVVERYWNSLTPAQQQFFSGP